ncbi:hypothetical protein F5Y03DRAFT_396482 [Xylaria venustula]|nr:hypothetical protein F5Y03DRAFT_396482 [Xylaria venustula]
MQRIQDENSVTPDTVNLGPPHAPKEESIKAFTEIEPELKKELLHLKHTYLTEHEPEYFAPVQHLPDTALTSFSAHSGDLTTVRVAQSAYGIHLLGKIRIPDADKPDSDQPVPAYLHVRVFVAEDKEKGEKIAKLHSIHTEARDEPDGNGKRYRAIFTKDDPLEWFDT